jgi:uncharacterized membrane protein YccC
VVAVVFALTHTYWVLLTIVTIMKPVYAETRKRSIQRVAGTLVGVLVVSAILYFISVNTVLLVIMIFCMLIGYSMLRVNYFIFVVFLTIFVVISFHFLNPLAFKTLIIERLVDTVIGGVIAAVASRFIFPVWGHDEIHASMIKMLEANCNYFSFAWIAVKQNTVETAPYEAARKEAVVALTNLSQNFQHMLAEPQQAKESAAIHQFVIANHMLTSHIAALSTDKLLTSHTAGADADKLSESIVHELKQAEAHIQDHFTGYDQGPSQHLLLANQTLNQLSMIHTLARDIRKITLKL